MALLQADIRMLRLMEYAAIELRGERWRFGTRTISEGVVARLIASGRVQMVGERIQLSDCQRPEGK
jgi:hypothetical protein